MISFVWSSKYPFIAGSGGSENYTAGHIRELQRRGIACRILTLGHGKNDGREDFPDIPFKALVAKEQLEELDDILIFITYPLNIKTKHPSYAILHCPPLSCGQPDLLFDPKGNEGKRLLAPSKFAAKLWSRTTKRKISSIVYPFAAKAFSQVKRPIHQKTKTRILFAGRLTPDKGIYTLLASLHMPDMRTMDYELTATTAGNHSDDGQVILKLLKAHPNINIISAQRTSEGMAAVMSAHDIVIMPSTNIFWQESFGIVSVEAQHTGCRVVASDSGGLPETNCGGLILVKPDDPLSLARGIEKAAALGPLTVTERMRAATKFTVETSVNKLLNIIENDLSKSNFRLQLKKSSLIGKQLEFIQTLSQLSPGITRENKFAYRKIKTTEN